VDSKGGGQPIKVVGLSRLAKLAGLPGLPGLSGMTGLAELEARAGGEGSYQSRDKFQR